MLIKKIGTEMTTNILDDAAIPQGWREVASTRSPGCYKSGPAIEASGNTTGEELQKWASNNPEVASVIMYGIAESLGFPIGEVNNNNLHGFDHQASFPDHTTLNIGDKVIGLDMRCVEKAREDL